MKKLIALYVTVSAFTFLCALPAAGADGKAEGTLTVAKVPVKLVHAYAAGQKGFLDTKSDDIPFTYDVTFNAPVVPRVKK